MKTTLNLETGFSDHTIDFKASLYAVAHGATYIEKHFTIDKNLEGPDHRASLDPEELSEFVKQIRECEIILGDGNKMCKNSELNTRDVARKSLCYNRDLIAGHILQETDLISLRPYNGICVSNYEKLLDKKLKKNCKKYDLILEEDLF